MSIGNNETAAAKAENSGAGNPSVSEERRRVRRAWRVMFIYIFYIVVSIGCYEWHAYRAGVVNEEDLFLDWVITFAFIVGSIIACVRSMLKRTFKSALIYAGILFAFFLKCWVSSVLLMGAKAFLFSCYPQFCQHQPIYGQQSFVCYDYIENISY
jgi:hypothetical protein